jgi:putative ABC transport system permease protein
MALLEAVRIAFGMIRANKLRAFFTVLGTVVGVTFLIAVITLIEGMNRYVEDEFKATIYGVNTVQIRRTPSVITNITDEQRREWGRRPRLSFDDADWLEQRMETPGLVSLSASNTGTATGPRGREVENVWVTGASASHFQVREMSLAAGRPFTRQEADRGAAVVVIGRDVADALFEDVDPVGREIRVRNFPYQVIGVLERQGSLLGMSLDNVAIAPIRSNLQDFVTRSRRGTVDQITFKVEDPAMVLLAKEELESWMRIRHRLRPAQASSFELETADEALGGWNRIRAILLTALPGLVGISLVVGAIVIMNIMLVSVAERTREIGVRKSLGARRRDILWQFLVESSVLSAAGALIGIALGIALARIVDAVTPVPASVAPWSIGLAVVLGIGVGLAAGVYPAWRAAQLDPINALRAD